MKNEFSVHRNWPPVTVPVLLTSHEAETYFKSGWYKQGVINLRTKLIGLGLVQGKPMADAFDRPKTARIN